jgi:phage terminase large subunit-like protein
MSRETATEKVQRLKLLTSEPRFWYVPHARQKRFHKLGLEARERLFLAGNRVGKTLAGAAEVAFHLTGLYPAWWKGFRFERPVECWGASVTREATRDILQPAYLGSGLKPGLIPQRLIMDVMHKGGVAAAADVVRVRHVGGGVSTLGFKSYDQGRLSFQGTARDVIHLDEEPPIEVYEECLLRTLTTGGHILLTMTPLLGVTEVVRHFASAERGAGKAVVKAAWQDAPHLKSEDMHRLRQSLRPHEVAARERGVPMLGRGKVFPVEEKEIGCERFEIPEAFKKCVGIDFGWSNPTAAVWLAHDGARDVVYVTDIYWRAEATPAEHAAEILRRGEWIPAVGDPAGQAAGQSDGRSLFQLYEKAGLRLQPAANDVETGLMALLERMRSGRFKVFLDCVAWWEEFRNYARDMRGKIIKRDDHLLDATRYALMSGLPIARAAIRRSVVRPARDWRVA